MKRLSPILAAVIACLVAAPAATAAAPTEGKVGTALMEVQCFVKSKNVITKNVAVQGSLINVDPSQAKYAKCPTIKKVASKILSLRIEMPKIVEGFRCTPRVTSTSPDVVRYSCLFRGADTATEIRLKFTAKYDLD